MLIPPIPEAGGEVGLPTQTLFVVDVSGSMQGPSIEQARSAILAALDRLRPGDSFDILKFNATSESFRDHFQDANPQALDAARDWVRDLEADGGTEIYPALLRSLDMMRQDTGGRVQRIIFLTDGAVGDEERVYREISRRLGSIRLHAIGIGTAPNSHLMRKMALFGHGLCEFISNASEAGNRIDAFFSRLDRPVMTDLSLRWEGVRAEDVHPDRLPDLHAGEPLVVSLRLASGAGEGTVVLSGRLPAGAVTTELPIRSNAPTGSGVAARWARAKVESLLDSLNEGADQGDVRRAVIELAKAFHLVTRYTSLVAVEEFTSAQGDARTVTVANALPAGTTLLGELPQGGTSGPLMLLCGLALTTCGLLLALALRRS